MGIVLVVCDSHRRKAAIASHLLDAAVSTHLSQSHPILAELKVTVSQKNIIPIVDKSVSKMAGYIALNISQQNWIFRL